MFLRIPLSPLTLILCSREWECHALLPARCVQGRLKIFRE